MTRTVIPKDCILDDVCNKQLSDEMFIATEDFYWFEGWVYCQECYDKYKPHVFLKLVAHVKKGTPLGGTELAQPIIIDFKENIEE